jgi:serine/threonine protein kinase
MRALRLQFQAWSVTALFCVAAGATPTVPADYVLVVTNIREATCRYNGQPASLNEEFGAGAFPQGSGGPAGAGYGVYVPVPVGSKPVEVVCELGWLRRRFLMPPRETATEEPAGIRVSYLEFPPWVEAVNGWASGCGMGMGQFSAAVMALAVTFLACPSVLWFVWRRTRQRRRQVSPGDELTVWSQLGWPYVLAAQVPELRPLSKLGHGGIGSTFLCADFARGGERAAVKILHEYFASEAQLRARFLDEAVILKKLKNTGLVPEFYRMSSPEFELPWFSMEALDYMLELRAWLAAHDNQRPPLDWAHALVLALGEALNRLHEAGVIHRDLSPDNIFFRLDGTAFDIRIIDFGGAKAFGKTFTREEFGHAGTQAEVLGKLYYSPPEQMQPGGTRSADQKSDSYSYGVIVWKIITGQYPFTGRNAGEVREAHATSPRTIGPLLAAGVSPAAAAAIVRLLAVERQERASVPQALEELGRCHFSSSQPVGERSEGLETSPAMVPNPSEWQQVRVSVPMQCQACGRRFEITVDSAAKGEVKCPACAGAVLVESTGSQPTR